MIRKIDHLGIAVRSLAERLPFWSEALGLRAEGIETVNTEGVRVAFLPVGEVRLELLESLRPDSAIARFVEKRGEGIHHVTFEVESLDGILAELRTRGLPLLDEAPRSGAEGTSVAFLHPRAAGGVLVELVERSRAAVRGISPEAGVLERGAPVLAYLRDPGEKLWGIVRRLDPSGLVLEGLDLASFEDWARQIARGENGGIAPSVLFFPMGRVERLLLDRASGGIPSMCDLFRERTGRRVEEVLEGRS